MRGKLLGDRYRIQNKIGEGGMAFVYVAYDEKLSRKVAVKILHKHMASNADIRKRFFQEAQAISSLDHPNILKIFDFSGEHSEDLWMVTEVLQGSNLGDYVNAFPGNWLHPVVATMFVRETLKALSAAHQEGLIHRDVKPENIFVLNIGRIRLMDFGIAKNTRGHSMTLTGTFMGSPSYMSPEQIRGKAVDHRSDLYSLGILFYEIVTGKLPYTGNSTHDVVMKICEGKYNPPVDHVPNLPEDLNKIICKAMAKHPMHRYQEARTFARDLDIFLTKHDFEESNIELERYFTDRDKFDKRLRKLSFTNGSAAQKKSSEKPKQKLEKAATTRTQRTRMFKPEEMNAEALRQKNQEALLHPKKKSELNWPQTKHPNQAPRRDHQIPKQFTPSQPTRTPAAPQQRLSAPNRKPVLTPQPRDPAKQFVARAKPRRVRQNAPKRKPSPKIYYRLSTYAPRTSDWVTPVIGILIVALIGLISVMGFYKLQQRSHKRLRNQKTRVQPKTRPQRVRPKNTSKPKPSAKQKPTTNPTGSKTKPTNTRPGIRKTTPRSNNSGRNNSNRRKPNQNTPKPQPENSRPIPAQRPAIVEPQAKPVINTATKPIAIPIPAQIAQIKLSSRPAAEIYIDGKRLGTTVDRTLNSGWIKIKPGYHRVELRRTGYKTHSTRVNLGNGQRRVIPKVSLKTDINYTLILSSNRKPVRVILQNLSDRSRKTFLLRGSARTQSVPAGRYQVKFEYKGKTIVRNIAFTGTSNSKNLNIEFKE